MQRTRRPYLWRALLLLAQFARGGQQSQRGAQGAVHLPQPRQVAAQVAAGHREHHLHPMLVESVLANDDLAAGGEQDTELALPAEQSRGC